MPTRLCGTPLKRLEDPRLLRGQATSSRTCACPASATWRSCGACIPTRGFASTSAARFGRLNAGYREKFGSPFIIAVRTPDKAAILAAFERRLGNTVP